jgi:uncharacterized protein
VVVTFTDATGHFERVAPETEAAGCAFLRDTRRSWSPAARRPTPRSTWLPGAALVNGPGLLSWNDLLSPDVEASAAFYRELFGWTIEEIPEARGQYWSIANDGDLNGGLMPMPPGGHPAWNLYFGIEDVEAAIARAAELGAEALMGPMPVPSGRFAVLRDPHNAVFSVVDGEFDP